MKLVSYDEYFYELYLPLFLINCFMEIGTSFEITVRSSANCV
jgi:hypothetical protein